MSMSKRHLAGNHFCISHWKMKVYKHSVLKKNLDMYLPPKAVNICSSYRKRIRCCQIITKSFKLQWDFSRIFQHSVLQEVFPEFWWIRLKIKRIVKNARRQFFSIFWSQAWIKVKDFHSRKSLRALLHTDIPFFQGNCQLRRIFSLSQWWPHPFFDEVIIM